MGNKFKVIRTWYVEAEDVQDAIDKSKNLNHDEVVVAVERTTLSEKKYCVIYDENMYDV